MGIQRRVDIGLTAHHNLVANRPDGTDLDAPSLDKRIVDLPLFVKSRQLLRPYDLSYDLFSIQAQQSHFHLNFGDALSTILVSTSA